MAENKSKETTIVDKFVDLLSKTKDALIADLKAEFVSVREAVELSDKEDKSAVFSLEKQFSSKVNIIDAVFAKVGYDISHYENLSAMKNTVMSLISTIDKLSKDISDVVKSAGDDGLSSENVAEFAEAALPHIQTMLSLVKDLADTEWKNVEEECVKASQDVKDNIEDNFLTKDFARKVLDHILITLLKNAKDVFKDEIEFVRVSAVNIGKEVSDYIEEAYKFANDVSAQVKGTANAMGNELGILLKEALVDYKGVRDRLAENISEIQSGALEEIRKFVNSEGYEKLSRALSITYSILDFLGVVKETKVTLKLPSSIKDIIAKVEEKINEGGDGLKDAISNLSEKVSGATNDLNSGIDAVQEKLVGGVQDASTVVTERTSKVLDEMGRELQMTKDIANLSASAIGAVSTQLDLLYDKEKGLVKDLQSFSSNLCGQINTGLSASSKKVSDACKEITSSLEKAKNFTYPVNIVTVNWNSVESLFRRPVKHFKELYPIDTVEDAENLMRRMMGIVHQINPDIPDFDSLRNLLESLLKRLQQRVIKLINEIKETAKTKIQEAVKAIKETFEPIITSVRKVIEMLREVALALRDRMYGVLNDVKKEMGGVMLSAQEVIEEVQRNLKLEANVVAQSIDKTLNKGAKAASKAYDAVSGFMEKVDETIEEAGRKAEETASEAGYRVEELYAGISDSTLAWKSKMLESLPRINMPKIVRSTIADPVMDCVSGVISDMPSLELKNPLPLTTLTALHKDIMALQRQIGRSFTPNVKNAAGVSASKLFEELGLKDLSGLGSIGKDANLLNLAGDVENIVSSQLQAWAYSVYGSIRNSVSPSVWMARMDSIVTQLQAEFQNDLGNITGLMSKEGVQRLFNDSKSVKQQLRDNLQVGDYVTIVQGTLSEVVLPNPEFYFDSLKATISNIIGQVVDLVLDRVQAAGTQIANKRDSLRKTLDNLIAKLSAVDKASVESVLKKKGAEISKCASDIADRFIEVKDNVLQIVEDIKSYWESLVSYFTSDVPDKIKALVKDIQSNFTKIKDRIIENIKNRLSDLANEIWSKLRSEVVTPVLRFIKDRVIAVVKEKIRLALKSIIDGITKVEQETAKAFDKAGEMVESISSQLAKVPCIYDLSYAIKAFSDAFKAKIGKNQELKSALKGLKGIGSDYSITDLRELPSILRQIESKTRGNGGNLLSAACADLKLSIVSDMAEVQRQLEKEVALTAEQKAKKLKELIAKQPKVEIPVEYVVWVQSLIQSTMDFIQSDMEVSNIVDLVVSIYNGIPDKVKEKAMDIMPSLPTLPDNAFTRELKKISCDYDLDNKFCNVTLLNLDKKNIVEGEKISDFRASLLIQMFMFVGSYRKSEGADEKQSSFSETCVDEETGESVDVEVVDEGKPALYVMFLIKGDAKLVLKLGEKHSLGMDISASAGAGIDKPGGDKGGDGKATQDVSNLSLPERSLGFCLTKKTEEDPHRFHGFGSTDSLSALLSVQFNRIRKDDEKTGIVRTKYLDINVGDYPQVAYVLYNHDYPENVQKALKVDGFKKIEEADGAKDKKEEGKAEPAKGFTAGYMASIEDLEVVLKLRQNEFFKQILKDDISSKFSLSLLYDYKEGFKIGGGYNFHLDIDCSNLQLGKLRLQNLGIDIGSLKDDWGTLQFQLGSTFGVDFGALALSFENLGVGMDLNVVKPDFSLGDWNFDGHFKFPSGIGMSVDTEVVKGTGMISYDESTGELVGALDLSVIKKFGVSAFVLADLGTVAGHSFSLVAIVSTHFNPGIPLGMGFSLTGLGGCLGLMRMIDRQAVIRAVSQGTMATVFFMDNVQEHLAEIKSSAMAIFPAKRNQFFLGFLGQISYAPVLSCDFGLMLQVPDPAEVMIVGSLKVTVSDSDVIRINVQFGGGIDFREGIWFDASLIDSEIVGIKLEGSMAFRLYWGGATKGFLLSVGGFHPRYTPEPGMMVNDMKRLAMKLDYSILKIGLETYMAVTSNTFQIGARLDLCIGWSKFGITGYAGFDALFQFDPFMFMFSTECGVCVKCGSWKLLSVDLALNVSGPAPWHVDGKAKFKFLFIPISVDFCKEWGRKTPKLPEKTVAVYDLLKEEIDKPMNWMAVGPEIGSSDDEVVLFRNEKEGELLVQPFESLSFNQSVVPLDLDRSMDLCNNAVPTDYDGFSLTGVEFGQGSGAKAGTIEKLENDFAPSLYFNLTKEEKLTSPSYRKYRSGFSVDSAESRKTDCANKQVLTREYQITVKAKASAASAAPTASDGVKKQMRTASKVEYAIRDRKSFERYAKLLDKNYTK